MSGVDLRFRFVKEYRGFTLWWYSQQGHWTNLKLTRPRPKGKGKTHKKFNWWLGWDQDRQTMRRCRDQQLLEEHNPKTYEWVVAVCKNVWPHQNASVAVESADGYKG